MPDPTPAPASASGPEGFLGHLRDWFERDIEPRITAAEADLARVKALAPELATVAATLEAVVKALAPSAAPEVATLITDAEKAAVVIARIAAELGAAGL
jgi:hypothetical protein